MMIQRNSADQYTAFLDGVPNLTVRKFKTGWIILRQHTAIWYGTAVTLNEAFDKCCAMSDDAIAEFRRGMENAERTPVVVHTWETTGKGN